MESLGRLHHVSGTFGVHLCHLYPFSMYSRKFICNETDLLNNKQRHLQFLSPINKRKEFANQWEQLDIRFTNFHALLLLMGLAFVYFDLLTGNLSEA